MKVAVGVSALTIWLLATAAVPWIIWGAWTPFAGTATAVAMAIPIAAFSAWLAQ